MTESCATQLGLERTLANLPISGIGNSISTIRHTITTTIYSRFSKFSATVNFHVLPHITANHPDSFINVDDWEILKKLDLADPQFYRPSKIDILIGAELLFTLLKQDQYRLASELPILQSTELGWVVAGKLQTTPPLPHCNVATTALPRLSSLEKTIQQFFDLEDYKAQSKTLTEEEEECEKHFKQTFSRAESGRFTVRLPFRRHPSQLGNSHSIATRRFKTLERKLVSNPELQQPYTSFIHEYIDLNHMQEITTIPTTNYFLPHHCVIKPDSLSTRLRVVFDGSAKTSTNLSLNDLLMVGPTIQPDLFTVLINFRTFAYVFMADIRQMYRQILIHEDDRKYQMIVWRDHPNELLKPYLLNTVTYGTSSAPYLATRYLVQLAEEEEVHLPKAAHAVLNGVYIDNFMTGANGLSEAKQLKTDIISLLAKGQFELRKFCANDERILEDTPVDHREPFIIINDSEAVKTLGMIWQPHHDVFKFSYVTAIHNKASKRTVLSDLGKNFDPLGLIGPLIVKGKLFMQLLWKSKLKWDSPLADELKLQWDRYIQQLNEVKVLSCPRHLLGNSEYVDIQLHAFSDSSEVAYGTCCYLRTLSRTGEINCHLICSKSRVSPLKSTTLPRLELQAAVIMVELVDRLTNLLQLKINDTFYHTDSQIVLAWISQPSYTWVTFVANRVAKIQELSQAEQWRHVPGTINPADLISRGCTVDTLRSSFLWFQGPSFLTSMQEDWRETEETVSLEDIPERKSSNMALLAAHPQYCNIIDDVKYNDSLPKLERIFAYVYRFYNKSRKIHTTAALSTLPSVEESSLAHNGLVLNMQLLEFKNEYNRLQKSEEVDHSSRLRNLCPFIGGDGLLRVQGRLENAPISYDSKHQIILPKRNKLTNLIFSFYHLKSLHAGPQSLLGIVRQKYWPLDGLNMARRQFNKCQQCFRMKPKSIKQFMGDLPSQRVTPGGPFLTTGVDFCGPFKLRYQPRSKTTIKGYIAVFVCFTTKAVHLEAVGDLSTASFIAALRRFIARRGICQAIFCDNATNFLGARNELSELAKVFDGENLTQIAELCRVDRIEWRFIPPKSPHFGGLWEAAVKSAKHHLIRVAAHATLNYEELSTLTAQIEAILNSRPITPLSSSPNDLEPLTPGHFLIGRPLTSFPEPCLLDVNTSSLTRFRRLQQIQQQFWQRWSRDYLLSLQEPTRWYKKSDILKADTIVLIHDDNLPPYKWLMGRIIQTYPGSDGLVRVAEIKTKLGIYKRTANKLYPLPM